MDVQHVRLSGYPSRFSQTILPPLSFRISVAPIRAPRMGHEEALAARHRGRRRTAGAERVTSRAPSWDPCSARSRWSVSGRKLRSGKEASLVYHSKDDINTALSDVTATMRLADVTRHPFRFTPLKDAV